MGAGRFDLGRCCISDVDGLMPDQSSDSLSTDTELDNTIYATQEKAAKDLRQFELSSEVAACGSLSAETWP